MLGSNLQALSENDDLARCFSALSYSLDPLNLCNKMSEAEHLLFCLNGSVQKTFFVCFFLVRLTSTESKAKDNSMSDRQSLEHNTISMIFSEGAQGTRSLATQETTLYFTLTL